MTEIEIKEVTVPTTKIHKIIKEQEIGRCSRQSADVLAQYLTKLTIYVGKRAAEYAEHAKRKTITPADIKLALDDVEPKFE